MTRSVLVKSALATAFALSASGLALAQGAAAIPAAPPFQAQPQEPDPMVQQRMQEIRAAREAMMKAKRALEVDRRIASVRRALELTPEQQNLFKPVEDAMRGLYGASGPQHPPGTGRMLEADQRLRVMADRMRARADALGKLADAMAPFRNSLTDPQKQRFDAMSRSVMMHGKGMMGQGMMGRMGGMMGGGHACMMMGGQRPTMGRHDGWGGAGRGWGGGWGGGMWGMGGMSGAPDYAEGYQMEGMGGMSGMSGMGADTPSMRGTYGMGGMAGMYGWPNYNRVPQGLDQRRPSDQGWGRGDAWGGGQQTFGQQDGQDDDHDDME